LSDQLQGARCLELIEETLRGVGNSEATLNLVYDTTKSIAGTTWDNAGERIGNAAFEVIKGIDPVIPIDPVVPPVDPSVLPRWKKSLFLPIPRFSNTFQRHRKETPEELKDVEYGAMDREKEKSKKDKEIENTYTDPNKKEKKTIEESDPE
jgi:hypothetical protein